MNKKSLLSFIFLLAVLILLPFTNAEAKDFPSNPLDKPGYKLDFNDEFNGPALDRNKWTDYYLPHWCDNPEDAKANYRFENGSLVEYIKEDQKPWCPEHDGKVRSSAIMSFDKSWVHNFSGTTDNHERNEWKGYTTKYGYFEIRAKLSNVGGGGHQAWWMVGMQDDTNDWFNSKQTGEIDILETFFSKQDTWRIAAYGWNDPNFQTSWYLSQDKVPEGNPTSEYHVYGMEWSPSSLKFYYDNKLFKVIYGSPDYEMGTILNIYTDAGSGTHNDVWPKEWAIDYFRVWKPVDGYPEKSHSNNYLVQNRQTGKYMYISQDNKNVVYGDISAQNEEAAKWEKEYRDGYVLLKNKATGEYINIESQTGYVEHGIVPNTWWSAQWKEISEGDYTRLVNRWKYPVALHTESYEGVLQYGNVPETYWTSQWRFIPVE
ncbi:family 16 glycosylhydrolase [Clostridium sp. B9]|uniref:family 16 glycosylhydrolase n=1 Tax=Clostridium sp. B9 TaxID=3423224 RepID=UPI003D2F10E9